jgi:hypothetical protein
VLNRPQSESEFQKEERRRLREHYPALVDYLDRVDAKRTRNFKSHAVQEMDEDSRYWRDRVRIKIENDGSVKVSVHHKRGEEEIDPAEFEPTAEEQEAIKAEVAKTPFPTSIGAGKDDLPPVLVGVDAEEFFRYLDASGKFTTWIQWRKLDDERRPYYVPYTLWSDNVWRPMEPDGLLPLYGLERLKPRRHARWLVMLHEGAKCARHVQRLVEAKADHPWIKDLNLYTHLGWPGGVNSADRVDWSPIKRLEVGRGVVLVCDHDVAGENVASTISRILQRAMTAVKFNDDFPESFDLADDWPKHDGWRLKDGRYRGPTLDDLSIPATWATRTIPPSKKGGRPLFKIVDPFAQETVWVAGLDVFINRQWPERMLTRSAFNSEVSAFSDAEDTARLLDRLVSPKVNGVTYRPGKDSVVINVGRRRLVNMWRPTDVEPIEGDPAPFVDFMEKLFPIAHERREVLRWCVTLVARPDVRMRYGLLTISEIQGVGKSTLGEAILSPLVGRHNTSYPTEHTIVESSFTSWVVRKRLAVIHEIDSGDDRTRKKVYNKLKSALTETEFDVNEKYIPEYTIEIQIHAYACSNSKRAIYLVAEDRRWFVPMVTETLEDRAYWEKFHAWLREDGLGIILAYFRKLAEDPAFVVGTGEHAPTSATKEEVIAESRSVGEQIAFDLARHALDMNTADKDKPAKKLEEIVLAIEDVRAFVALQRGMLVSDRRLEKSLELRKAMKQAGLFEPKPSDRGERLRRYKINRATAANPDFVMSYVVANFEIEAKTEWEAIKARYRKPGEVWPM